MITDILSGNLPVDSLSLSNIGLATLAWLISICLLIAGIIGIFIPVLPSQLFVIIAAVSHHLITGEASGLSTRSFVILALCMLASQALELTSGAAGSRWFGGSKWGSIGAIIGSIIGLFFAPAGLFAGPLLGAIIAELSFAKKDLKSSGKSGVGSAVGVVAGMIITGAFTIIMITLFLMDALHVF